MKPLIIFIFLLAIRNPSSLECCTAFCIYKEHGVRIGKNLDWPVSDGFIMVNKTGVSKSAMVNTGEIPARWTSKYGSVTFNQFGREFPLGGMNEKGLVVEELSYSPSVYPSNDRLPSINELQWIQYQLDNYTAVREVIDHLPDMLISKLMFGLHYFICDRTGDTAVIEFINGNTLCYHADTLPVKVLSNNSYRNSIKYLKLHQGFGGERTPTQGPESQERFVRAALLINEGIKADTSITTDFAFSVLDKVEQIDTQWSIIYNPVDLSIEFRISATPGIQLIEFNAIEFSDNNIPAYFEIGDTCTLVQSAHCFSEYSSEQNRILWETVFKKLVDLEEIDTQTALFLIGRFSEYYQHLDDRF